MREIRLFGTGDLRLMHADPPVPTFSESLVRVRAVGICGSDLHWYSEGGFGQVRLESPLVLGHEFAGTVEEGPLNGHRVAIDPCIPCGSCARCRDGNTNLCPAANFAGHDRHDGGLREYVVWPTHLLYPVPDSFTYEEAAMLEPLGVALHAFDLGQLRIGGTMAVVGCGPIGLLLLQAGRLTRCAAKIAIEPLEHRRVAAGALGADVVVDPADDLSAALAGVGAPDGVDVAFEAAGTNSGIAIALELVRAGGRVVLTGIPTGDSVTLSAYQARRKGLTISFVRRMKHAFPRTIQLVEQGAIDVECLVSKRFHIDEVNDAFTNAASRAGLKTVVLS